MKKILISLVILASFSVQAEFINRVMKYLNDNTNTTARSYIDFQLRDDGNGPFIYSWDVAGVVEPTTNDLPASADDWTTNYWPEVQTIGTSNQPIYQIYAGNGGIDSKGRGKFKGADIEAMDANYGLILTDTNGVKWLVYVNEIGSLLTSQVSGSPEISMAQRIKQLNTQRNNVIKTKKEWEKSAGIGVGSTLNLSNRVTQLEKFLGLRELDNK